AGGEAGGVEQRSRAALERGQCMFQPLLGRIVVALVQPLALVHAVRRMAEGGGEVERRRQRAGGGVGRAARMHGQGLEAQPAVHGRAPCQSAAKASRAAAMVCSISASPCAEDTKPASKADGARYTPRSSMPWKKRRNAATSQAVAPAKLS